jgi:hypothetical protein
VSYEDASVGYFEEKVGLSLSVGFETRGICIRVERHVTRPDSEILWHLTSLELSMTENKFPG